MEAKVIPLGDYILVSEIKESVGVLLTPDNMKGKIQKARVVAVSDDVEGIFVDDTVLYAVNRGHEIGEYKLVLVSDLLAKI